MNKDNAMNANVETITINGVEYVRADSAVIKPAPNGKRAVLVIDRGWVVAGDVEDVNGRIRVTRALHVRSWTSVGFDGMIANPKSGNVVLKPMPNGFDCPADAELFRVPVSDDWGL